jgi:hypothetical protein
MKTMFLAAAAVLSFGIGSAFAGDGDGNSVTTLFTSIPGQQASLPAASTAASRMTATAPSAPAIGTFVTKHDVGTWLFPPAQNGG